ncbi:MAG TPA: DUF433 domain-containing protein [Thermoanaerobaculia bacterium]|nr:DUF433 domain-containing protein [Thermoanaerobaculia bacterium]
MLAKSIDLYGGRDPRELPVYGPREAAACLNIPESTLLHWTTGHLDVGPVLTVDEGQRRLSFFNLLEAFVVDELRRRSRFSLQELRRIIDELRAEYPQLRYPLAEVEVSVTKELPAPRYDAVSASGIRFQKAEKRRGRAELFTQVAGEPLVNISGRGRHLVLTQVLQDFLKRVEKRPAEGIVRLYPFITKDRNPDAPKTIALDPTVAFGKPVITGTGIPTAAIYQLFTAGDEIREIAEEYDRDPSEIEAAIRYESVRAKRAA